VIAGLSKDGSMFQAWKRSLHRAPDHAPIRWVFLGLSTIFLIQSAFYWQPTPLIRIGVLLVGLGYVALFVAESFPPARIDLTFRARLASFACLLFGGVLLIAGGIVWLAKRGG
jgi:hypothetical protein